MEEKSLNKEKILVVNRWRTPDGTILQSKHCHDYQSYKDANGDTYMVDGGHEYLRTSVNDIPMEDLCLYEDDNFEEIRKYFMRGTFDEDGNRIWKALKDMSSDHIKNCIQYNIDHGFKDDCLANRIYRKELNYRKSKNI